MNKLLFLIILLVLPGCMTRQSIIESTHDVYPYSAYRNSSQSKLPYNVGVVIDMGLINETVRSTEQSGGLKTIIEFKLGKDIVRTLPVYLKDNFKSVEIFEAFDEDNPVDIVFIPDVSSSKLDLWTRASAGISYELVIKLKVTIIRDGKYHKILNIVESTKTDVSSFASTEKLRNPIITDDYEALINKIYLRLDKELKESL